MNGSTYFDIFVSNEHTGTVEIRPLPSTAERQDTWLYEITDRRPDRLVRGTITWDGEDRLDLIRSVLADYLSSHPKSALI